jgi:hypothetical protein
MHPVRIGRVHEGRERAMQVRLYEYAVILQPKTDRDENVVEEAEVVVSPATVLAANDEKAGLLAARAIPETHIDRIDRLTVLVRPFA